MILCKETWCNVIISRSPHPVCFDKKKKNVRRDSPSHTPTPVQGEAGGGGGVVDGTLLYFLFVSEFRNNFAFSRKPLIFSTS